MFARLFPAAVLAAAALSSASGTSLAQGTVTPEAPPAEVQVQPLQTLDLFTTPGMQTGLPTDLWRGTSAPLARLVLPQLGQKPLSPAAAMLARRVLAAGANAPDGAGSDADLAGERLLALIAVGDAVSADVIARKATNLADSPLGAQAAAEAALIGGDDARACAIAQALKVGRDGVYWLKLRTYCQAIAGQTDAAQLTFALANEMARDPVFRRLMGAKLAGAGPPGAASLRDGLDLALTRSLALDPAPALDGASIAVAAAVARTEGLTPDTRTAAAARAVRGGLTLDDLFDHGLLPNPVMQPRKPGEPDFRAVDTEVQIETVLQALVARLGVAGDGGLAGIAYTELDTPLKARALGLLLGRAKSGSDFVALARLALPALDQLAAAKEPLANAMLLARAAAAAGDLEAARAIRSRITADQPEGGTTTDLALLDATIAAAGGGAEGPALDNLVQRGVQGGPRSPAQSAALILMALGAKLSPDARAELVAFEPPRGTASPAKLALHRAAVAAGSKGETALLTLAVAMDSGWAGPAAADRARMLGGLREVGLGEDARAFAVEGLVGLK